MVLVASPHTFDPSLGDLFATWAAGGCAALCPRAALFVSLGACLSAVNATHVLTTPAMLATIRLPPPPLPALRVVALGGEPMPRALAAACDASSDSAARDARASRSSASMRSTSVVRTARSASTHCHPRSVIQCSSVPPRWSPGITHGQPFSIVASVSATQHVRYCWGSTYV